MTHFCLTWEWLWLFNNKLHGFDLISKLVKIKYHLSRSLQVCGPNLSGFILSFFSPQGPFMTTVIPFCTVPPNEERQRETCYALQRAQKESQEESHCDVWHWLATLTFNVYSRKVLFLILKDPFSNHWDVRLFIPQSHGSHIPHRNEM